MNNVKFIFFIVYICFMQSCNSRPDEKKNTIIKDFLVPNETEYPLSKIFEGLEIIKPKGELFGNIKNLAVFKNSIVFLTKSGKNRLFLMDITTGEYEPVLAKGNAPYEMESIDLVKAYNDHIYAYDVIRSRIKKINLRGETVEDYHLDDSFNDIAFLNDTTIVGYKEVKYLQNDKEFRINVLQKGANDEFHKVFEAFEIGMHSFERAVIQVNNLYSTKKGEVHFTHSFSDTIYNISNQGVTPKYRFDFEGKGIAFEKYNDEKLPGNKFFDMMRKGTNVWNINTLYENENFVFFTYWIGENIFSCFIDKIKGESIVGKRFVDDILSKEVAYHFSPDFLPLAMDEDYMYVIVEAYHLLETIGLQNINTKDEFSNLSIENNPILLKLKFKKDE